MNNIDAQITEVDRLVNLTSFEAIKGVLLKHKSDLLSIQQTQQKEDRLETIATSTAVETKGNTSTSETMASSVVASTPLPSNTGGYYIPVETFAWDQGDHKSPSITVYVDLPGVGTVDKSAIQCDFKVDAFSLVVNNLNGKNYKYVPILYLISQLII